MFVGLKRVYQGNEEKRLALAGYLKHFWLKTSARAGVVFAMRIRRICVL
jgi:hypothetical protein